VLDEMRQSRANILSKYKKWA